MSTINITANFFGIEQWKINLFFGLSAVEIILNLSTYFVTIFCFYVISKNPLFHTNLIRLIKCVFIYFLVGQVIRLVMIIKEFSDDDFLVQKNNKSAAINVLIAFFDDSIILGYGRMLSLVMTFGALGTIVFERICATIWLKTYEKTVSNLMFAFCLFCHIPVACGFVMLMYSQIFDTFICGILILSATIFGYFVLLFLEWFNKKRYKASLSNSTSYTLSERFQLQENIRTALLLKKIVIILSGGFLFIGGCIIASYFYNGDLVERCTIILLNYLFCFCSYTFPLFGVSSNTISLQTVQRIKSFLPRPQVSSEPLPYTSEQRQASLSSQIRGFDGSQIIFSIDEEREVYFKQLQAGWN